MSPQSALIDDETAIDPGVTQVVEDTPFVGEAPAPEPEPTPVLARPGAWALLAGVLLLWNLSLGWMGGPWTILQRYDGPQYQLLARNRMMGHYEVGDKAHTVRLEGRHPMWRPGLVWLTQGFAHLTGSVRMAAGIVSGIAVTLLELAMLIVAYRFFGSLAAWVLLALMALPTDVGVWMIRMTLGQGPEPWSTAALLSGVVILVEAFRRGCWKLAVLSGVIAGLADWFRTGNLAIFPVPCLIYAAVALWRRESRKFAQAVVAGGVFLIMVMLGDQLTPSPVAKSRANLWGNLVETYGEKMVLSSSHNEDKGKIYIAGLQLAPGTNETYYDYIVRKVGEGEGPVLTGGQGHVIRELYWERLQNAAFGRYMGLRGILGPVVLIAFLVGLILAAIRREPADLHTLALSSAALAFYFGPIVLLSGDEPTHYTLVVLPFFVLVAVRGMTQVLRLGGEAAARLVPVLTTRRATLRRAALLFGLPPLVCFCAVYQLGVFNYFHVDYRDTQQDDADLAALELDGKRIACRNMTWHVDRPVELFMLPYARVEQLEEYARVHQLDGILIWEDEPSVMFTITPYGITPDSFERAMQSSKLFGPARRSGTWAFYPVTESGTLAGRVERDKP